MEFACEQRGSVSVVKLLERRMDARSAPEFRRQIDELIAAGQCKVVLDLSEIDFIDSSGLGAIVSSLKALGAEGHLLIGGARPPVERLFKLTRMDKVFRMFPAATDAVAAVSA